MKMDIREKKRKIIHRHAWVCSTIPRYVRFFQISQGDSLDKIRIVKDSFLKYEKPFSLLFNRFILNCEGPFRLGLIFFFVLI